MGSKASLVKRQKGFLNSPTPTSKPERLDGFLFKEDTDHPEKGGGNSSLPTLVTLRGRRETKVRYQSSLPYPEDQLC